MYKSRIFDRDASNLIEEPEALTKNATSAYIIGAFKPLTAGHFNLILKAASECTNLYIYFSKQDRRRARELPIYFEQSKYVFETYIAEKLPNNVYVYYTTSPTQQFFNDLTMEEICFDLKEPTVNILYTDNVDSEYIKNKRIAHAFPKLTNAGKIQYKEIERKDGNNISATMVRKAIKEENFNDFKRLMPSFLTDNDLKRIMVIYRTTLLVPRVELK